MRSLLDNCTFLLQKIIRQTFSIHVINLSQKKRIVRSRRAENEYRMAGIRSKKRKNVALFAHLQCYLFFLRSHFIVCHFLYSHNKQCPSPLLSMTFANKIKVFFLLLTNSLRKNFLATAAVNFLLDWNRNLIIDRQKLIVYS